MGTARLLLGILLLCFCVGVSRASPSPPQAAQRDFRPRHHAARDVPNPLLSSRQVLADDLRRGSSKRQNCPTPQVSGGCCPPGKSVCGTICTDTSTDPGNCGTCGTTCSSGVCNDGTCCPNNEPNICYSVCTNIAIDPMNCGGCEHVCGAGQVCSASLCQDCQRGFEPCSNTCVSLQDPMNCGFCGNVCPSDEVCSDSTCQTCSTGLDACGNVCTAIGSTDNCGACTVCAFGSACFTLPGVGASPPSYECNNPYAKCTGYIQVWAGDIFYGYLTSDGFDGGDANGQYTYSAGGTPFSIQCIGGSQLDLTSLNPVDFPFIYACATVSDGTDPPADLEMTGCDAETAPASPPSDTPTEIGDSPSGNIRLSETAMWNMDPSTFEITATWIPSSGPATPIYIIALGDDAVHLSTELSGSAYFILTLIFGASP